MCIRDRVYGMLVNKLEEEKEKIMKKLSIKTTGRDMNTEKWSSMSDKERKNYIESVSYTHLNVSVK